MGHLRQAGAKGLRGTLNNLGPPLLRFPQHAAGIAGFAPVRADEVHGGNTQGGSVAEDVAGGLRAGQADEQVQGAERRGRLRPDEGQRERLDADRHQGAPTARAVDQTGVKSVPRLTAQHVKNMTGAGIPAGEVKLDFCGAK